MISTLGKGDKIINKIKYKNDNLEIINDSKKLNSNHFFLDFNSEKHKKAKAPKQAYLYFPKDSSVFEITALKNNNKGIVRKFFEGSIKYSEYEICKLNDFIEYCKTCKKIDFYKIFNFLLEENENNYQITKLSNLNDENHVIFEKSFSLKKTDIFRFLISNHFEFEKTINALNEYDDFNKKYKPIKLTENMSKILLSGFIYIHGRDNRFRPIIILRPSIFLQESKKNKNFTYEDWMLSVVFLLDYCIDYLFIPGQIESWNIICDMNDVSLYSVPSDLKSLLGIIQNNYKNRLNAMFVMNLSTFANILWGVIKGLMGENIQKKIKMISSKNNYGDLYENINRAQLEKKYGGFAEDVILNYGSYFKNLAISQNSLNGNGNNSNSNKSNSDSLRNSTKTCDLNENLLKNFFFPPNMPSEEYLTDKDLKEIENILISEEDYIKLVKSNKEIIQSPYYNYCQQIYVEESKNVELKFEKNECHYLFDNQEFFSCRDYFKQNGSTIISKKIDFEKLFNNNKENQQNSDDINKYHSCEDPFAKHESNNCSSVKIINLGNDNNHLKKEGFRKKLNNNKVTFLQNNKNKCEKDLREDYISNISQTQDIQIENENELKKCKVSCGQVKIECLIY